MSTFVGAAEAARLLGVTKPTLYAYVSRGVVQRRAAPDGRTSLYDLGEIERLVARSRGRGRDAHPTIDVEITSAITRLDDGVRYRGHLATELAVTSTFEQVAELLWTGTLPSGRVAWPVERVALDRCRAVVDASGTHDPMVALALAATVLPADEAPATARRFLAIAPNLVGDARRGSIADRLAGAWVRRPSDQLVRAISCALVLAADHELATSTLAVRVACSVRAEPAAAIAAGLQVVRGPMHGGASRAVAALLEQASLDGARNAVRATRSGGGRVPGFGHTVYRNGDPRLAPLLDAVRAIPNSEHRIRVVDEVLAEAGRVVPVLPNIDLGLGALMHVGGLPHDAPILAIARVAGWAAHYDEESEERPVRYRGVARPR